MKEDIFMEVIVKKGYDDAIEKIAKGEINQIIPILKEEAKKEQETTEAEENKK